MNDSMPESTSVDQHCDTCVCNQPRSLDAFNRRCDVLARSAGDTAITRKLPIELRDRIAWSGVAGLRWTGWKLGQTHDLVAGQLIACLTPGGGPADDRYFAVSSGRLIWPPVFEYRPGDMFDISDAPRYDEIELMMDWPDGDIEMYFRLHANALVDRIAREVRPRQ